MNIFDVSNWVKDLCVSVKHAFGHNNFRYVAILLLTVS